MQTGRGRFTRSRLVLLILLCATALGAHHALTSSQKTLAVSSSGGQPVTALVLPVPPTLPAIIESPANNTTVDQTPLVVSGTCQANLTVRVLIGSTLAGSTTCLPDGTFTVNIILDTGTNILSARSYDAFDQPGPTSATVTVIVREPIPTSNATQAQEKIQQAIGLDVPQIPQFTTREPLFQGTALGPLAKLLGIDVVVSRGLNQAISILIMFIAITTALLFIVLVFGKRLTIFLRRERKES